MAGDRIRLVLVPALEDPPVHDPEYQSELRQVDHSFSAAGVKVFQVRDLAKAVGDGETLFGEFIVTLGPPVIAALAAVAGAWVQARYGRKVRVKIGEVEAEARSTAEIETLLKRALEFRQGQRDTDEERT